MEDKLCLCCDFGAHDMPCTCDGSNCCHPNVNHDMEVLVDCE
jgi:hypothetical protein